MFVESLAGKAGALHAIAQDSTPFQFDENGKFYIRATYETHTNLLLH
jgi:DNA-directed RNA polymerase I subunit RPA2